MNDAPLVRGFESRRQSVARSAMPHREGCAPTCDPLRQILALDEFHRERAHAVAVFEAVNLRDVRMVERRERLRFAREAREAIGVVGERVRQDFKRDVAVELRITRPIDLPHPAFTDLGRDDVDAEAGAGTEGQRLRDYTGRRWLTINSQLTTSIRRRNVRPLG